VSCSQPWRLALNREFLTRGDTGARAVSRSEQRLRRQRTGGRGDAKIRPNGQWAFGLEVRIISARRATKSERHRYETGKHFVREPDPVLENSTVKSYADMDELPPDFDFSKGEIGKKADDQHLSIEVLLNQILKREMAQIRAGTGS
jgi:hypothetical protein